MNRSLWRFATRFTTFRSDLRIRGPQSRNFSTKPDDIASGASQKTRTRIQRIQSRLPRYLHRHVEPLVNAPLTHITAFLVLHEITALVPLVGLAATFHYTKWMPPFVGEGKWVADGVEKYGNYLRKKGWLGEEDGKKSSRWGKGEGGTRIVIEYVLHPGILCGGWEFDANCSSRLGTAYAITKALLPLRLLASVWTTPWFAKVAIVPCTTLFRRFVGRKP